MSVYKELNRAVTGSKFINKNEDEYLYASLSQPPIKIRNEELHDLLDQLKEGKL